VWDSATLRVRDGEERAALAEREALERVASGLEGVVGFVWQITLLEDELMVERQAQEVSEME
jgi:hypothetical protein